MVCPYKNTFYDVNNSMPEEFSEWNDVCQDCRNFQECKNKFHNPDEQSTLSNNTFGDNFPTYGIIHKRILLHQERCSIIEKALLAGLNRITKDDIIDEMIDVELYNKECRKEKIKKQYKKKKEKQNE